MSAFLKGKQIAEKLCVIPVAVSQKTSNMLKISENKEILPVELEIRSGAKFRTLRRTPVLARKPLTRSRGKIKPRKKAKSRAWKFKKTELAECDAAFAREIRERDGHCMYPGCQATENLTCSHYIGRANWNTRFNPENCITLCIRHHFMDRNTAYEFQKARENKEGWDGRYTLYMMELLRPVRWMALLERATGKKTRKQAILETQEKYGLRQPEKFSPTP